MPRRQRAREGRGWDGVASETERDKEGERQRSREKGAGMALLPQGGLVE